VTGFQLTGFPEGGERFQMARVRLEAEDPQGIARRDALFQTAAFCRIFHGSYKPVRVVTRDSSGNVTKVKGSYDTIQEAINAATTVHGDVVQVSSNDKTPYAGFPHELNLTKSLTFEGGYDSADWNRHYADPDNPGQIHEDYETILKLGFTTLISTPLPANSELVIDGFTWIPRAPLLAGGVNLRYSQKNTTVKIINNKHFDEGLTNYPDVGQNEIAITMPAENSRVVIAGNVLEGKPDPFASHGILRLYVNGRIQINNNRFLSSGFINNPGQISISKATETFIFNNSFSNLPSMSSIHGLSDKWTQNGSWITQFGGSGERCKLLVANNKFETFGGSAVSQNTTGQHAIYVTRPDDSLQEDLTLNVSNNLFLKPDNKGSQRVIRIVQMYTGDCIIQNNMAFGVAARSGFVSFEGRRTGGGPLNLKDLRVRIYNNFCSGLSGVSIKGHLNSRFIPEITNNSFYGDDLDGGMSPNAAIPIWYQPTVVLRNYFNGYGQPGKNGVFISAMETSDIWGAAICVYNIQNGISVPMPIQNNIFTNCPGSIGIVNFLRLAVLGNNVIYNDKKVPEFRTAGKLMDSKIINNIIQGQSEGSICPANLLNVTIENNVTQKEWERSGKYLNSSLSNNIISNDPKFVDPGSGGFGLASGSPAIDAGKPDAEFYDPYDKVKYPTPDPDTTPALPPAQGTIRNDIGAYGGPGAGVIGFVQPTKDDPKTEYIREDVIGTY
jgi:hypothetical protein